MSASVSIWVTVTPDGGPGQRFLSVDGDVAVFADHKGRISENTSIRFCPDVVIFCHRTEV